MCEIRRLSVLRSVCNVCYSDVNRNTAVLNNKYKNKLLLLFFLDREYGFTTKRDINIPNFFCRKDI